MRRQTTIFAEALLLCSALVAPSIYPPAPAQAESAQPNAFARNIWSTISFLDESSRLAGRRSRDSRLREFARSEAAEQTAAANAVAALLDSTASAAGEPPSRGERRPGSVISLPFRAAATVTSGMADAIDGVQTGRSVAVEPGATERSVTLKDIKVQSFGSNLQRLTALSGRDFDAFYKSCQIDALLQLSTLYASYIQAGGDPGLRALAVRELPKINQRLALIKTM